MLYLFKSEHLLCVPFCISFANILNFISSFPSSTYNLIKPNTISSHHIHLTSSTHFLIYSCLFRVLFFTQKTANCNRSLVYNLSCCWNTQECLGSSFSSAPSSSFLLICTPWQQVDAWVWVPSACFQLLILTWLPLGCCTYLRSE